MRYYSDVTKKFYDSATACEIAENEAICREEERKLAERKKNEARAADAKIVEEKRKKMNAAQREYREELEKFCKNYGSYHYTAKSKDDVPTLFDSFFNFLG